MKGHFATLRGQCWSSVHRQRHEAATQSLCHLSVSTLGVAVQTYSGSLTKSGFYPLQAKAGLIKIPLTACCLSLSLIPLISLLRSVPSFIAFLLQPSSTPPPLAQDRPQTMSLWNPHLLAASLTLFVHWKVTFCPIRSVTLCIYQDS